MKITVIILCFLFAISCSSQSVSKGLKVEVNGSDLLIFNEGLLTNITDVIVPELGTSITMKKSGKGFFLTNMYTASHTKGLVYYSFAVHKDEVFLDRMFQLKLDSKNGIAFGWLSLFNNQYNASKINSTLLESLTDVISYSFNDSVVVFWVHEENKISIKRSKFSDRQWFEFPIFYNNDIFVGQGCFEHETGDDYELFSAITEECLESKYWKHTDQITKSNVIELNNVAFYIYAVALYYESVSILEAIVQEYPSRVVAYINLGDAYWALNELEKAKQAYGTYIQQMKANGKESRIPSRVLERAEYDGLI